MEIDQEQTQNPKEKTPAGWHKFWEKEKTAAEKRMREFTRQGNEVTRIFLDERERNDIANADRLGSGFRLNLFWKNVSTLLAMLYGNTPQIEVKREFDDPDDDIARVAAVLIKRMLQSDVEASGEDLATSLKAALQDRLLPGLGVGRVRYDFDTTTKLVIDPNTLNPMKTEVLSYEDAPVDYVHWQDFLWGWGRTWSEIPWLGYRAYMDKEEATARFGGKKADKLEYSNQLPTGPENHSETGEAVEADLKNNIQKAQIWEFWNKADKKVYWFSPGAELILDVKDDPLRLDAFWPSPRPMVANLTTKLFMPKADYCMAQDLYAEADELQTRIAMITRAVKVVGVYDETCSSSVGRMLEEAHENDMIPVDNWAMFAEKGGLQGVIAWFPVQDIVGVLQTLKQVLGDTMELLYEVTGMSDIMRGGNTDQYTAASTNELKAKMGSIQVQALQDEFARFASDLEGLKAEVIAKHFSVQSIAKQASAQFLPQADQDKTVPALELIKSPDIKWRVNIKPESIAMIDHAQLKSERSEFLTAMATYIQSASGAAQNLPGSLPFLLEMLKWGMAGFKGADVLEGTMDAAIEMAQQQPPEGKEDDGKAQAEQMKLQLEQLKQQGAQQKLQGEMQKLQMKAQLDMQAQQSKLQAEIAKIEADNQADMTVEQQRAQARLMEIGVELEANIKEIQAAMQSDLAIEQAQAQFDIAAQQTEHNNTLTEMRLATSNKITELNTTAKGKNNAMDSAPNNP